MTRKANTNRRGKPIPSISTLASAKTIFAPPTSQRTPLPLASRNRQVSTGIGLTRDGWVLEGRQPGCVLNRKLSAETLSHILIEDNLLVLGIPARSKRGLSDDDESEGRGNTGGTSRYGGSYKPATTSGSFEGVMNNLKLSAVRSQASMGGKSGSWSAPASAMGSFGVIGADGSGKEQGAGEGTGIAGGNEVAQGKEREEGDGGKQSHHANFQRRCLADTEKNNNEAPNTSSPSHPISLHSLPQPSSSKPPHPLHTLHPRPSTSPTSPPSLSHSTTHPQTWPPLPHLIPLSFYPSISLNITHAHRTGTPSQTTETLDLLSSQIYYLTAHHPYEYAAAPRHIVIQRKVPGVHIVCDSRRGRGRGSEEWTGALLLHVLRAVRSLVRRWGVREVGWGVLVEGLQGIQSSAFESVLPRRRGGRLTFAISYNTTLPRGEGKTAYPLGHCLVHYWYFISFTRNTGVGPFSGLEKMRADETDTIDQNREETGIDKTLRSSRTKIKKSSSRESWKQSLSSGGFFAKKEMASPANR
ncbi:hypothetical protein G7Y79_00006g019470 [Physcia stellaris]|nr:hypothetical protein G7Y79_00006g019470 [Physcia stellaris]